MTRTRFRVLAVLATLGLAGVVVVAEPAGASEGSSRHVLLISVDGLHNTDLARLVSGGVNYTNAQTPFPSDSFPGMVAQVTGGNPKSTGIFYDDSYNHALLPAGTTSCAGVAPGVEVTYFEAADKNPLALDAGQGLAGLPDSILNLSGNAKSLINPAALPVDPATCAPIYPNNYLKVNTVFQVANAAGLRTAWSDKHPAYLVVSGPTALGPGVQDFFTPEINSLASVSGTYDWTQDNALTQIYDGYKVQAVINEINGFDHSGKTRVGTPNIFGMNFQSISTAQKLPGGGYMTDGATPSAMLENALDYINTKVGAIVAAVRSRGLLDSTTIILSAKHGQSPTKPSDLTRIDDGAIQATLDGKWEAQPGHSNDPLVAFAIDDDGWLMWVTGSTLAERTVKAQFAANFLKNYKGTGNNITGASKAFTSAGLDPTKIFAEDATAYAQLGIGAPGDPRVPDVVGIAQLGTVYTGKKAKIAEHGGDNLPDRHVALFVSGAGVDGGRTVNSSVETTQIAPTILELLGLDPHKLLAVQKEGTKALAIG
jgi:hypothetical protein